MLARAYLLCRLSAYLLSLIGLFLLLHDLQAPTRTAIGRGLVLTGFLLFFCSYAMRFVLRRRRQAAWHEAQQKRRAILARTPPDRAPSQHE